MSDATDKSAACNGDRRLLIEVISLNGVKGTFPSGLWLSFLTGSTMWWMPAFTTAAHAEDDFSILICFFFVSVDNSEVGYGPLTSSPSPPPTKHHRPESSRALLHGILSGQHPGLHAHALITAHRTSAYTTTTTGTLV